MGAARIVGGAACSGVRARRVGWTSWAGEAAFRVGAGARVEGTEDSLLVPPRGGPWETIGAVGAAGAGGNWRGGWVAQAEGWGANVGARAGGCKKKNTPKTTHNQ